MAARHPSVAAAGPAATGRARDGSWSRIASCSACSAGRRVEPELVGEQRAGAGEGAQRVGLPSGAVEGEHLAAHEPLAQRVLVGHALEPGRGLGRPIEGEQGVEPRLDRREAQLVPADDGRSGPLLVAHVHEARTTPLTERRVEQLEGCSRLGPGAAGWPG